MNPSNPLRTLAAVLSVVLLVAAQASTEETKQAKRAKRLKALTSGVNALCAEADAWQENLPLNSAALARLESEQGAKAKKRDPALNPIANHWSSDAKRETRDGIRDTVARCAVLRPGLASLKDNEANLDRIDGVWDEILEDQDEMLLKFRGSNSNPKESDTAHYGVYFLRRGEAYGDRNEFRYGHPDRVRQMVAFIQADVLTADSLREEFQSMLAQASNQPK